MSLLATVTRRVETAFNKAGDLVATVTWVRQTFGEFDPATGLQAVTAANRTCRAISGEWEAGEAAKAGLSARAIKIYIPQSDFVRGTPIEPEVEDKVIFAGVQYTVKAASWEGVKVLWEVWADV